MSTSTGSATPTSPTYCRPQHLDRERLRRLLARTDFENVCFHEAVVALVLGVDAPAFKLLAVTSDALLLFPLGSGGGGSASPAGLSTAQELRVGFGDIVSVAHASPTQTKLRGMMLHASSELFEVVTATQRVYVATFEPNSRAFFYVARAFRLEFQKRILRADLPPDTHSMDDAGDLHDLLQDLLSELSDLDDAQNACDARCQLLDELATAAMGNQVLQKLCFEDQTPLGSCLGDASTQESVTYGLAPFLLAEIELLGDVTATSEKLLVYELSLLQLLHRLLFGGHWVPARLRFFLHTPLETWLRVATHVPTLAKAQRSAAWRVARDELIDLQAALLLELHLLQEEAALLDPNGGTRRRDAAAQALLTGPTHDDWAARVFKRVAVLLARSPVELEAAQHASCGGSRWSLALWRATRLLRKLLRVSSLQGDSNQLASMLRRRRRDYLDLYMRNPRFGRALAECSVPHLVDVADSLLEILDTLS